MLQPLSPEAGEDLMQWIYDTSLLAPFLIAATEAPSYRRVALERMREAGTTGEEIKQSGAYHSFGIRDGNGIMFVSSTGGICPVGFLPRTVGNVRTDHIAQIYRNAPVSNRCMIQHSSRGAAGFASSTTCAAALAPGRLRRRGIHWRRIPSAFYEPQVAH